jgi:hypothetical protein
LSIRSIEVILKGEFRLLRNLVVTSTKKGDRIEVRDRSGNLIREESGDQD